MDQPELTQFQNIPQQHMSHPHAPPPYSGGLGGVVGQGPFLSPFSISEQPRFALSDSMIHQVGLGDWAVRNDVFIPHQHHGGSTGSVGGRAGGPGRELLHASSGDISGE